MSECEHNYVYGGVKYEVSDHKLPGSGSSAVYYFDWFYCSKCTEIVYKKHPYNGEDTYMGIKYKATPK